MFDQHAVDNYRSITAPTDLKDRVLRCTKTHKPPFTHLIPAITAVAACLVLLSAVNIRLKAHDSVTISSNGTLGSTSTLSIPVRTSAEHNASRYAAFTISIKNETELDTHDTLFICDQNGTFISEFPYKTDETVTVYWYITSPSAVINVNGTPYTLYADTENNTFTITQNP